MKSFPAWLHLFSALMYYISQKKKICWLWEKKKSFLERLRFHNLASFEVETAKVSCYCIGAEGIFFMPQLRGWGEGWSRWLCSAIMKGQSLRGFKRLVSTRKMKSSFPWIASLVLRFKYISQIVCSFSF